MSPAEAEAEVTTTAVEFALDRRLGRWCGRELPLLARSPPRTRACAWWRSKSTARRRWCGRGSGRARRIRRCFSMGRGASPAAKGLAHATYTLTPAVPNRTPAGHRPSPYGTCGRRSMPCRQHHLPARQSHRCRHSPHTNAGNGARRVLRVDGRVSRRSGGFSRPAPAGHLLLTAPAAVVPRRSTGCTTARSCRNAAPGRCRTALAGS